MARPRRLHLPRLAPKGTPANPHEYGGAAMEYLLVSTFAAVVTIAALGFIGSVLKEKLQTLADRMGSETSPELSDPFQ